MKVLEVSVVIPVLNSREKLARCLESLATQHFDRPFEVVVVDDGSDEDLTPIRDRFQSRLTLSWLRLEKNSGPAIARNAGIQAAHGDIILFTDADCRPDPDWMKEMSRPFADPQVTGCKGVYLTDQTDLWARLAQIEFEERYELLKVCTDIDFVDTYSGGYRRADLLAVGGFDTSFPKADNEDVDLSFRVKKKGGRFVFVPSAKVWHHHREGMFSYANLKFWRGYWRMQVYARHPEKAGRESYTPLSLKAQLGLLLLLPLVFLAGRCKMKGLITWMTGWLMAIGPLLHRAWLGQINLVPWVPLFCFVRGAALLGGMLCRKLRPTRR